MGHKDVCRGGNCKCCKVCGEHSFAAKDGRCLYCFPSLKEEPAKSVKQKPAATKSNGTLKPIKPNSRSKAADALRREQLYRESMGLDTSEDEGIHA